MNLPALWPLFHYLLWQDVASEAPLTNKTASASGEVPEDPEYAAYAAANRAYAKTLAQVYRPGDLVLIHDYHLLLVPRFFREELRALEKQAHVSEPKQTESKHDGEVAEEADEGVEDGTKTVNNVVHSHRLQSTGFDKKSYLTYLKVSA